MFNSYAVVLSYITKNEFKMGFTPIDVTKAESIVENSNLLHYYQEKTKQEFWLQAEVNPIQENEY